MIPLFPKEFSHPVKIGGGGFGNVYRVRQQSLGRNVAVKVIYEKGREKRARLLDEAKTQASLHIQCIPQVYNAFEYKGRICIVMQWIKGVSLKRVLKQSGLSPDVRKLLANQVIEAVSMLHSKGYAHRDIKPDNILVSPEGGIYLIDFSFTKHVVDGEKSMAGIVKGTPAYMAPELWSGSPGIDYMRADVFSTGKILREIIGEDLSEIGNLITECTRTTPKWRPENCMEIQKRIGSLDAFSGHTVTEYKDIVSALTSDLLSKQLFSAGKILLDSGRDDEAYWLLNECIDENPDFNPAVDLIDTFPQRAAKRVLKKKLGIAAVFLFVILLFVGGYLFNRLQIDRQHKNSTAGRMLFSESDAIMLDRLKRKQQVPDVYFINDKINHRYLSGKITVADFPENGTLFIDKKVRPDIDQENNQIELGPGTYRFSFRDKDGETVWRERVSILPFENKRIHIWITG